METNLHTRRTQRKSTTQPSFSQSQSTHNLLDIPLRPRTPPLRIHRTFTTNNQHPQIRMSDVGRPPMGRHQRHLRRKSEQRARLSRLEKFLGRRARRSRERHHGDSEHLCRTRTGKTVGNWSVSWFGEFKSRCHRRRVCPGFLFFFFSKC